MKPVVKKQLEISNTDEEIENMSKLRFKPVVAIAVENTALESLNACASVHSKSSMLIKKELSYENYFKDKEFHKSDIELLFALKTRMIDLKKNFPSKHKDDIACLLCKTHKECQEHLLQCPELLKHLKIP